MKRYIFIEKSELKKELEKINRRQNETNVFHNIAVKPYKGQKHPAEGELVTIIIG